MRDHEKRYLKYGLLLLCSLLCMRISSVYAATGSEAGIPQWETIFSKQKEDLSLFYLGQIFGTIGNILHSSQAPFLGMLFRIINI